MGEKDTQELEKEWENREKSTGCVKMGANDGVAEIIRQGNRRLHSLPRAQ